MDGLHRSKYGYVLSELPGPEPGEFPNLDPSLRLRPLSSSITVSTSPSIFRITPSALHSPPSTMSIPEPYQEVQLPLPDPEAYPGEPREYARALMQRKDDIEKEIDALNDVLASVS